MYNTNDWSGCWLRSPSYCWGIKRVTVFETVERIGIMVPGGGLQLWLSSDCCPCNLLLSYLLSFLSHYRGMVHGGGWDWVCCGGPFQGCAGERDGLICPRHLCCGPPGIKHRLWWCVQLSSTPGLCAKTLHVMSLQPLKFQFLKTSGIWGQNALSGRPQTFYLGWWSLDPFFLFWVIGKEGHTG